MQEEKVEVKREPTPKSGRASRKLVRQAMSIQEADSNLLVQKRMAWINAGISRQQFLSTISHLKGREYSDAVVEYDRKALNY